MCKNIKRKIQHIISDVYLSQETLEKIFISSTLTKLELNSEKRFDMRLLSEGNVSMNWATADEMSPFEAMKRFCMAA